MEDKNKELSEEQKQEALQEIQQSILSQFLGKRSLEHMKRRWHNHFSPKALARKKAKRKQQKSSRRRNRK